MTAPQESTPLARVLARVAAASDAPVAAAPQPVAPMGADIESRLTDIEGALGDFDARISALESAAVDDALAEADMIMAAALPDAP